MNYDHLLIGPAHEEDMEGARRAFEEFFVLYQPALSQVERHLEKVIEEAGEFAEAYRPWYLGLRDLFRGIYLTVRRIPLPDPESLREALHMFSFDSAVHLLRDLCISCRINVSRDWGQHFREHINMLLFSLSILNRQQEYRVQMAR